jgi:hypothetical protein
MKISRVKCDMCGVIFDEDPTNVKQQLRNRYIISRNDIFIVRDTCEKCSRAFDISLKNRSGINGSK